MDLNKEIQKIQDKVIQDKLPGMIEKHTEKMLEGIIEDMFRSYGDTAKAIKEKIEKKLDINLEKFDLVDYNGLVAQTIKDQLVQQVNLQPIADLTKEITGFLNKKSIKLSEIHQMVKDHAMEYNESDSDGEISFFVKENIERKWVEIFFDIEADKDEHECYFSFIFSHKQNRKTIFSLQKHDWKLPKDNIKPFHLAALNKLEQKIFRLYAASVDILFDDSEFDNEWYRYED